MRCVSIWRVISVWWGQPLHNRSLSWQIFQNSNFEKFCNDFAGNNFVIPAGADILIPPIMVHRNPKIYEKPLIWNPDNFTIDEIEKRHRYSFLGFSAGPRGCIGITTRITGIIFSTELNHKPWNSHCTFTECKSKRASMLERERNKFGYSEHGIFYGTFTFFFREILRKNKNGRDDLSAQRVC